MASDTEVFLEALFEGVPPEMYSMFWTLRDKRSHWMAVEEGTEAMTLRARELAEEGDVYVAVSVAREAAGPFRRIASDNSAGIMGLWADVDVADPDVHRKWNLPPTEAAALELLDAVGLPPTMTIHSGHGLQAWWLFQEFWEFEDDAFRLKAAELAHNWHTTIRTRAAEHSWTVDSTFDLARVMRVPGTLNHKGLPVVPVRLVQGIGNRYSLDDFESHCVDESFLRQLGYTSEHRYIAGKLELRGDAVPPHDKHDALLANNNHYRGSWERKRRDLKDQSPSGYDMSLASLAIQAGLTDQEAVNICIAARRKHGDQLNLRPDYWRRTIERAHQNYDREAAMEQAEEASEAYAASHETGDDEAMREARRQMMENITHQLGIKVIGTEKYLSDPPTYAIITPLGRIHVGEAGNILNWTKFREKMVQGPTKNPQPQPKVPWVTRFGQAAWDQLARMIFDSCEPVDLGPEATESGLTRTWLEIYLLNNPPEEDEEKAVHMEEPFIADGQVYIFGVHFRQWLYRTQNERVHQKDLGRLLRLHGCDPERRTFVLDGARTTRSVWRVPSMKDDS